MILLDEIKSFKSTRITYSWKYIKKTYVFSDSKEINNFAKKFNVDTSCKRPKNVSSKKDKL